MPSDPDNVRSAGEALLDYYDSSLALFGDSAKGAAWPDHAGRITRFEVGLDIILRHAGASPVSICDLGCGTGELYRHIGAAGLSNVSYVGVDRSASAIALARDKFPGVAFHCLDALACDASALAVFDCDYVFANGLFTVKHTASHEAMWQFMTRMVETVWPRVRKGVVFNAMSKIVDYERDDLFHVSFDEMCRFLTRLAGRAVGFRADYGLYEYMAYAVKPGTPRNVAPAPREAHPDRTGPGIPVCRPLLPESEAVLPYLQTADRARRYSNHGELVQTLAGRLQSALGGTHVLVNLASCGTSALLAAILAEAGRATADRPLAVCPSYTFVASVLAVEQAGYRPLMLDVGPLSWALDASKLMEHPALDRVGVVVVVAPYGRPFRQEPWQEFVRRTGIPVVIDGAACFEAVCAAPEVHIGPIPVVLSLHATKAFSSAEGGAVLGTDLRSHRRVHGALNFGFLGERICSMPSLNGRMSEYHAAVGLAELERWPIKRAAFGRVASAYRAAAERLGLEHQIHTAPDIASCYALFVGRSPAQAHAVERALRDAGVDYRRWYGRGVHREPHFAAAAGSGFPVTSRLAECTLGLPTAPDLTGAQVECVLSAVAAGVASAASTAAPAPAAA